MKTTYTTLSLIAFSLAGCAGSGDSGAPVRLSVAVPATASFAADACGNTLNHAKVVFRRVRLDGDAEASVGPFLVDLAGSDFDGTFQQGVLEATIPAGEYDRVRFEMHHIEEGDSSDPALEEMAQSDLSLRIEGTGASGSFVIESDVNDEQEKSIAVVIGDSTTGVDGITLTVDPSAWLGGNGGCLDPVTDLDEIEDNIRASIDLQEDDLD